MESNIYNTLKQGHKVGIGTDINQRCRDFVFDYSWMDVNEETVLQITEDVIRFNYFIKQALEEVDDKEELATFRSLIYEKVVAGFENFGNQPATPNQIYYYIGLCEEVGEQYDMLTRNDSIHGEITRLIKKKEKLEEDSLFKTERVNRTRSKSKVVNLFED